MTVDEAQKKVPQVRILIERKEESPEFDTNVIIEQTPVENTTVKINSEVYVVVSSGLQSYTIPEFSGDTAAKAKKTLEDVGLDVETVNRTDSSVPAGTVIMTDPPADSEVKKGDKVISVSYTHLCHWQYGPRFARPSRHRQWQIQPGR